MIAFFAPLKFESDILVENLRGPDFTGLAGKTRIYVWHDAEVVLAQSGRGKVQMGLAVSALKQSYPLQQLWGLGLCGALVPGIQVGDFISADEIVEHDFSNTFIGPPDPPLYKCDQLTLASINKVKLYQGRIASGDRDVLTEYERSQLHLETKALAATWESSGLARAARYLDLPFGELRMVSDSYGNSDIGKAKSLVKERLPRTWDLLIESDADLGARLKSIQCD